MRRLLVALAALACLALAPVAHAAKATLVEAGEARFPERAWILTLPDGARTPASQIDVSEDGKAVTSLRVRPANVDGGFGVVLAIDTSKSMVGAPIRDAMAAAREFASQRPPSQKLGIVAFNESASVLLRPTVDAAAIEAALGATPELAPGTHLYDGAAAAIRLLRGSGQDAGAIVVLSDGADEGSLTGPAAVAAAARSAHARIFTVGAGSVASGIPALKGLAAASSGEFLGAAAGNELAAVYRRLGAELASAYLVTYRSLAPTGRRVDVIARAGELKASAAYRAPALSVESASRPQSESFLTTDVGIAIVSLVALLAAFLILWYLLLVRSEPEGVRARVHRYGLPDGAAGAVGALEEPKQLRRRERLRQSDARASLAERLDVARVNLSPEAYLALWVCGGGLLTILAIAISGTLLMLPLAIGGAFLAGHSFLSSRLERQRRLFCDQLPDSLQTVASAMRTGHSFAGALATLVEEAPEPTATEFGRVIADERLGIPLEDAFEQTIRRMDSRDLEQVALVALLQRETGGNGAEALDRVVENLRGREEIRRLVRTLTAQGRLSRLVLTALPVATLIALVFLGGGYARPLFETTAGNVLLVVGVVLSVTGSLVIKRMMQIRV